MTRTMASAADLGKLPNQGKKMRQGCSM